MRAARRSGIKGSPFWMAVLPAGRSFTSMPNRDLQRDPNLENYPSDWTLDPHSAPIFKDRNLLDSEGRNDPKA